MELLINGLATYKLAKLITRERGPFGIFEETRRYFGRRANEGMGWEFLAELINCPYCLGLWIAIGITRLPKVARVVLAISAIQDIIQTLLDKRGESE